MKNFSVWVFDPLFCGFVSSNVDVYPTINDAILAAQNALHQGYAKRAKVKENLTDCTYVTLCEFRLFRGKIKQVFNA
ncbi:MAG: hypothetical protein J6U51_03370 [Bacteroidales bacterium]|nr:hypothetical protein [Bacteroidales bacterium]